METRRVKMTTQFYNVYSQEGELLMVAPMKVIAAAFRMRAEATHRVVSELTRERDPAPVSNVCFNGRSVLLDLNNIQICISR
jgi:hypothetical protein